MRAPSEADTAMGLSPIVEIDENMIEGPAKVVPTSTAAANFVEDLEMEEEDSEDIINKILSSRPRGSEPAAPTATIPERRRLHSVPVTMTNTPAASRRASL